jgi:hypothetical protein
MFSMQEQIATIVVCEDDKPTLDLLCEHLAGLAAGRRVCLRTCTGDMDSGVLVTEPLSEVGGHAPAA